MSEGRRYNIEGVLGKGGFGTVYRAELVGEAGFSKVVAVKVLNPEVSNVDEVAQRLRDEARILGLVRHRAIVKVDGLVQVEGRWAVIMEFVDGIDLKTLLKRGPLPLGPVLEIGAEVSSALRVALDQPGADGAPLGLLHRDIKPSNLQLTPAGEVKILDFGTARAQFVAREAKTQSLAFGTLDYMAPERLDFQDLPAGDVYALGSVLFELLVAERVGRTSPREDRHAEVLDRVRTCLAQARIPLDVGDLLVAMLAWAPERRPTIHEVERRLRRLRGALDEPWLAEWAGRVVPPLVASRPEPEVGDLSGSVVLETSGSRSIGQAEDAQPSSTQFVPIDLPPVATPPAPVPAAGPAPVPATPKRRPVVWLVSLAAVLALAIGGGWLVARALRSVVTNERAVPEVVASAEPSAGLEEPGEPEEVDAAGKDTGPPEAEVHQVEPRPAAAPAATPPAQPARTVTGRVIVSGDAESVTLISDAGRFSAGSIPPGHYRIEATFPGRGRVLAGNLTVSAGKTVRVSCSRAFARCEVDG